MNAVATLSTIVLSLEYLDFSMFFIRFGARIPTKIAIIAITMINSTSEKPLLFFIIENLLFVNKMFLFKLYSCSSG
jgi:hypothetical protein